VKRAIVLLLLGVVGGCGDDQPTQRGALVDADGNVQLELEITIAATEHERQEGLRLHGPLNEGTALLLVFPRETEVCISNAGVDFPIDVLFLSARRQIISAQPDIPANAPGPYCRAGTGLALELPGHTLRSLNSVELKLF